MILGLKRVVVLKGWDSYLQAVRNHWYMDHWKTWQIQGIYWSTFQQSSLSYLEGQNFQPQDYCTIWEEVRYPLTHRPKCLHFIISSTCHLKDKKRGPGEPQSSFPDRKDRAFSGNRRAQFMQRRWAREHAMGPRTGPLLKPKREKVLGYPNI